MEVFGTAVTAGQLILQFLDACIAYTDEAKSLKARFDWDIRVLEVIRDYFVQRQTQGANQRLSARDAALLKSTSDYLDNFAAKVERSLRKIRREGFLETSFNRAMWVARRADLKELEREIYEWTRRFDVRVLGLPPELRTFIPATLSGEVPAVVRVHDRLEKYVALTAQAKQSDGKKLLMKNSNELASLITALGDISSLPVEYEEDELVFASREVAVDSVPGTPYYDALEADLGGLAGALNCLDPAADIRLLKVEYYFYHENTRRFLFAHKTPYPTTSMRTLESMIQASPFFNTRIPLNERLKIAHKVAEALFFLHTAGFLHKNITSSSVITLRRAELSPDTAPGKDDTYLMGFDLVRPNESRTTKEGTGKGETPIPIWEFEVFQHPDRLRGAESPRYIKTYDVYSLGVVLLEIGVWAPLKEVAGALANTEKSNWPKILLETGPCLSARAGDRYRAVTAWCLGLAGDHIVRDTDFVKEVLDPLEDMINVLS